MPPVAAALSLVPDDSDNEHKTVEKLLQGAFQLETLATTPLPQTYIDQHGHIAAGDATVLPQEILRHSDRSLVPGDSRPL